MPVAVVFAPGSVPGDLPRPLPFRDVEEMEISVNGESPLLLSCLSAVVLSLPGGGPFCPWEACTVSPGLPAPQTVFTASLCPELAVQGSRGDSKGPGCCREESCPPPWSRQPLETGTSLEDLVACVPLGLSLVPLSPYEVPGLAASPTLSPPQ